MPGGLMRLHGTCRGGFCNIQAYLCARGKGIAVRWRRRNDVCFGAGVSGTMLLYPPLRNGRVILTAADDVLLSLARLLLSPAFRHLPRCEQLRSKYRLLLVLLHPHAVYRLRVAAILCSDMGRAAFA